MKTIHIVLSPHLDDAVLSLGGFIANRASEIIVITFFAGFPNSPLPSSWDKLCGFKTSTEAITMRRAEDAQAFLLLGVSENNLRYCSYLDIGYRNGKDDANDKEQLRKHLTDDIRKIIEEYRGYTCHVYFPLMCMHPDHCILHKAALKACASYSDSKDVLFYAYQDLPYSYYGYLKLRLRYFFKSQHQIIERFPSFFIRNPNCVREINEISRSEFERKLLAISAYKSQVRGINKILAKVPLIFSKKQTKTFHTLSKYCEVLYKI